MNFDIELAANHWTLIFTTAFVLPAIGLSITMVPAIRADNAAHAGKEYKQPVALQLIGVVVALGGFVGSLVFGAHHHEQRVLENIQLAVPAFTEEANSVYGLNLADEDAALLLSTNNDRREDEYGPVSAVLLNQGQQYGTIWKGEPATVSVDGVETQVQLSWLENRWALTTLTENYPEELPRTS